MMFVPDAQWWDYLSLLIGYLVAPRNWVPGEMVTSNMMNTLRDLFLEIEAGTAEMQKATIVGRTAAALASDLSAASKAKVAYDTTNAQLVFSLNGGAYEALGSGSFLPSDAQYIAMGL